MATKMFKDYYLKATENVFIYKVEVTGVTNLKLTVNHIKNDKCKIKIINS